MEAKMQLRVASALTVLLGIWVAISPVFISVTGAVLVSTIVVGSLLGVLGLVQFVTRSSLPGWFGTLVGVWAILSAIFFSPSVAMVWSLILSGAAAIILGLWDGNEVEQAYHPARA